MMRFLFLLAAVGVAVVAYLAAPTKFAVPSSPGSILVAGAGSGIGRHVAERLSLTTEFTIYGMVRNPLHANELEELGIRPLIADITQDEQVHDAVSRVQGSLVGVFYSAGLPIPNVPIEHLHLPQMKDLYDVTLFGLVSFLQATLPRVRQSKAGRIVLMGSLTGLVTPPFMGADPYRAVETVADALRREIKHGAKMSVSVIQAAFVASPIISKTSKVDQECRNNFKNAKEIDKNYPGLKDSDYETQVPLDRMAPVTVVSDAVIHAMFSPRPRIKYLCGTAPILPIHLLVPLLNILPHSLIDLFDS